MLRFEVAIPSEETFALAITDPVFVLNAKLLLAQLTLLTPDSS